MESIDRANSVKPKPNPKELVATIDLAIFSERLIDSTRLVATIVGSNLCRNRTAETELAESIFYEKVKALTKLV